ncbi:hypothetical protein Efla_006556 [Eimeria flavescens]
MAAFAEIALCPELVEATEQEGWTLPTPVQADAIPIILGGGDVCAAAETGSGKTGAFALPSLQLTHEFLRGVSLVPASALQPTATGMLLLLLLWDLCACAAEGSAWQEDGSDRDVQIIWSPAAGAAAAADNATAAAEAKAAARVKPVHLLCADADNWRGYRAAADVLKGRYMFEVYVHRGLVRVGCGAKLRSRVLGLDVFSFGFRVWGRMHACSKFIDYGGPFGPGDAVACVIDRSSNGSSGSSNSSGSISFYVNGKPLGVAFEIPNTLTATALRPGVCGKGFEAEVRFSDFRFPIEGVTPVADLSLADSASSPATGNSSSSSSSSKHASGPVCICIEPTRDLVSQTLACYKNFGRHFENPRLCIEAAMGGGPSPQKSSFQQADILVGTLDKLLELVKRRAVSVHRLQMLIIDEADDVIKDQGTKKLVELQQLATSCSGSRPQTLFFSATLHTEEALAAISQLAPQACWVDLKGTAVLPDTVKVAVYEFDAQQGLQCPLPFDMKEAPETDGVHTPQVAASAAAAAPTAAASGDADFLSCRIKQLKPRLAVALADALKMDCCMIVCRTNLDCDLMERYLQKLGGGKKFSGPMESGKENPYACVVVAGMRSTQDRHTNLEHFKAGAARFLICTDVAARGIDIHNLPFLIMLTLPDAPEQFFHRVGRVGRADCLGLAICLVAKQQERVCSVELQRNPSARCAARSGSHLSALGSHAGLPLLLLVAAEEDCCCRQQKKTAAASSRRCCLQHQSPSAAVSPQVPHVADAPSGTTSLSYSQGFARAAIQKKIGKDLPRLDAKYLYASGIVDPFGKLKALEDDGEASRLEAQTETEGEETDTEEEEANTHRERERDRERERKRRQRQRERRQRLRAALCFVLRQKPTPASCIPLLLFLLLLLLLSSFFFLPSSF